MSPARWAVKQGDASPISPQNHLPAANELADAPNRGARDAGESCWLRPRRQADPHSADRNPDPPLSLSGAPIQAPIAQTPMNGSDCQRRDKRTFQPSQPSIPASTHQQRGGRALAQPLKHHRPPTQRARYSYLGLRYQALSANDARMSCFGKFKAFLSRISRDGPDWTWSSRCRTMPISW
jgi:hypothetical protein